MLLQLNIACCVQHKQADHFPRRPHLLVVQPVPTYGPPVVAEVILNGWVRHLHGEVKR